MKYRVPLEVTFYGAVIVEADDEYGACEKVDDLLEKDYIIHKLDDRFLIDQPDTEGWKSVIEYTTKVEPDTEGECVWEFHF